MDAQVSDEFKTQALALCAQYLKGKWSLLDATKIDRLTIKPLHGLTNELYHCSLQTTTTNDSSVENGGVHNNNKEVDYDHNDDDVDDSPNQVVIRLYGKSTTDIPVQLEIVKLLASKNLGPKLYGCFDEGRLEQYLPSSSLTSEQMRDPQISCIIAKKIAMVQQIKCSAIPNNDNWIIDNYNEFYSHFDKLQSATMFESLSLSQGTDSSQVAQASKATEIPTEDAIISDDETKNITLKMCSCDFKKEIQFVKDLIDKFSNSIEPDKMPRVLSNNDLHHNNILLVDDQQQQQCTQGKQRNKSKSLSLEDRIVLIDFEYASNNFRAYEIANHLCEWRIDYQHKTFPYIVGSEDRFPDETQMKRFVSSYLKECRKFNAEKQPQHAKASLDNYDDRLEVDKFIEELKPFIVASDLFWTLWAIKSVILDPKLTHMWHLAQMKWSFYCSFKKKILKEQQQE